MYLLPIIQVNITVKIQNAFLRFIRLLQTAHLQEHQKGQTDEYLLGGIISHVQNMIFDAIIRMTVAMAVTTEPEITPSEMCSFEWTFLFLLQI